MFLATDLDGTFLGGNDLQRQQLYALIRENKNITLTFVTGRGLATVLPLLENPYMPKPDYIISDVGATIVYGNSLEPFQPLQDEIENKWPGHEKIMAQLKDLNLVYQQVPQQRRCSYFTNDPELIHEVSQRMTALNCDVLFSANKFMDVLPGGVNKGSTLTNLVQLLKVDTNNVLVAGDTLNDLSMYRCGFRSVVVGNAEQKLIDATITMGNVFFAKEEGAGGILESMRHFKAFESFVAN